MAIGLDPGYRGSIRSLGGVQGAQGHGLKVETIHYTSAIGAGENVVGSNSNRVWLLVQNAGTADLYISFGRRTTFAGDIHLAVGGTLQIDSVMPWTGSLTFGSAAALDVSISECSLQASS